jgi:hypothetical protein
MTAYHLEIRASDGRTICAADVEARKVGDVEAVKSADSLGILLLGETVAVGFPTVDQAKEGGFELYRWPLGETKNPVVSKIK